MIKVAERAKKGDAEAKIKFPEKQIAVMK